MIPYSRPKHSNIYTLSWSKLLENHTLHSAHTYIAHIWQYPLGPCQPFIYFFYLVYLFNIYSILQSIYQYLLLKLFSQNT